MPETGGAGLGVGLADELALLVEGVYASAQSSNAEDAAARVRALVAQLLGMPER
jgi:hypothetical protein